MDRLLLRAPSQLRAPPCTAALLPSPLAEPVPHIPHAQPCAENGCAHGRDCERGALHRRGSRPACQAAAHSHLQPAAHAGGAAHKHGARCAMWWHACNAFEGAVRASRPRLMYWPSNLCSWFDRNRACCCPPACEFPPATCPAACTALHAITRATQPFTTRSAVCFPAGWPGRGGWPAGRRGGRGVLQVRHRHQVSAGRGGGLIVPSVGVLFVDDLC